MFQILTKTTNKSSNVSKDASLYENVSEEDGQWRAVDVAIYSTYYETSNTRLTGAQGEEDSSSEAEKDSRL